MVTKEDIQNLATLARLKLSDTEVESLQKDISSILEYVGQVNAVSGDEARSTPLLLNVMREDTPRLPAQAGARGDLMAGKEEAVRAAFPKREGGYNVVRKIIQKDE